MKQTIMALAFFTSMVAAQEPVLLVKLAQKSEPLALTRLAVDVRITGAIAETRTVMTFGNPHQRALEGDLVFPLPEGAVVSGYALDIKGVMVDGVVVEREKGRQVFEKIVRQGIDPGLAEWVKGNNFRTRIFPIPAGGSRTVMVRYLSELGGTGGAALYHLPLKFKEKIRQFSLRIEVVKSTLAPQIKKGALANFTFASVRDSFVAETTQQDATLTEDMLIALPDVDRPKVYVEKDDRFHGYHFYIADLPIDKRPAKSKEKMTAPARVSVLWDASGSRGSSDHQRELALLRAWLGQFKETTVAVDLIVFRNAAEPARPFIVEKGDTTALVKAINELDYDGGTQMGAISPPTGSTTPDLYLLFTDGLSNFGREEPAGFKAPVYVFSADPSANHPLLRWLAQQTGGEYFNLKQLDDAAVLAAVGAPGWQFISAKADSDMVSEIYPHSPQPVHGRFYLAGKLREGGAKITVSYGAGGKVLHQEVFTLSSVGADKGRLLRTFWAQKKIQELQVFPKRNEEKLTETGKRYGLVTPGTSLIVLENIEQYVEHRIPPPESLPEMLAEYERRVGELEKEAKVEEKSKLDAVVVQWQGLVAWWNKDFVYPKDFRYQDQDKKSSRAVGGVAGGVTGAARPEEARPMALEAPPAPPVAVQPAPANRPDSAVAAAKDGGKRESAGAEGPAIAIQPWSPDTPYLQALKAAEPAGLYRTYLKQRANYHDSTGFYLDCADVFFAAGQQKLGLRVLSNLAELDLENPPTLRILAHRLEQLDRLDLAAGVYEEVLRLRSDEPQSWRDLGLVLARLKQYRRAIDLLYHVVQNKWERFDGIELITLLELNAILPRAKEAGVEPTKIDPRLIKLLDVDTRIVLTWDADLTDMDLWVFEPSGEKAFYGHQLTTIGGHVSKDFTQGYGPEEYLLRKAMPGVFKIQANYYGSRSATLLGPVTLQVDVFTNFGRPNEQRKSLTLRLTTQKETITVGEVKF